MKASNVIFFISLLVGSVVFLNICHAETGVIIETPEYLTPADSSTPVAEKWKKKYLYTYGKTNNMLTVNWAPIKYVGNLFISNIDLTNPMNTALRYDIGNPDYVFDAGNTTIQKLYRLRNAKHPTDADLHKLLQKINLIATQDQRFKTGYYWIQNTASESAVIPKPLFMIQNAPHKGVYLISIPISWSKSRVEALQQRIKQDNWPNGFMSIQIDNTDDDGDDINNLLRIDFNIFK